MKRVTMRIINFRLANDVFASVERDELKNDEEKWK